MFVLDAVETGGILTWYLAFSNDQLKRSEDGKREGMLAHFKCFEGIAPERGMDLSLHDSGGQGGRKYPPGQPV